MLRYSLAVAYVPAAFTFGAALFARTAAQRFRCASAMRFRAAALIRRIGRAFPAGAAFFAAAGSCPSR